MDENSKVEYRKQYNKLGVTPEELYLRQKGKCWLTVVYDSIEGEKVFGDIYCTDGKEYSSARGLLNPTYECAVCFSDFLTKILEDTLLDQKLNSVIVDILVALNKTSDNNKQIFVNRSTFDSLEEYISRSTLSSIESSPIKIKASGKMLLFGAEVCIINDIANGLILVEPGSISIKLNI